MANRQDRIAWAERLVREDPTTSKRTLQVELRQRFGVGLSDTTRRNILQKANTPNVLRARLISNAFTIKERRVFLTWMKKRNPPYLKDTINYRYSAFRRLGKEAKNAGKTFKRFIREFRVFVKKEAKANGWAIAKPTKKQIAMGLRRGDVDIYAMIREFRKRSIGSQEYIPVEKPKVKLDKGDISAQKTRYREKQAAKYRNFSKEQKREYIRGEIQKTEIAMSHTTGQRLEELKQQKVRLERALEELR